MASDLDLPGSRPAPLGLHWLCPLLACALYLLALGELPLQLPDESREAEVAREVWEDPQRVPHLNGKPYVIKTPLAYWTAAAGFEVVGDPSPDEWLVRLPSALFTLATAAFVGLLGWRWFSPRHGLLAGLILCASPSVLSHGRRFTADPALMCCVTVSVGAALLALNAPGWRRFGAWLLAGGAALALSFLAKGPVGIVLTGSALAGALLLEHGLRGLPLVRVIVAALTLLALAAPAVWLWFAMLHGEGGQDLVEYYLGYHSRGFQETELNQSLAVGPTPHENPWWFYAVRGPDGFLPWLLVLPLLALGARERAERARLGAEPAARTGLRLLGWFLLPFLFLCALAQKREVYLMPLYPPLALLAAGAILDPLPTAWPRFRRAARRGWLVIGAGAWLGAAVLLVGGVAHALWSGWYLRAGMGLLPLLAAAALPLLWRRDAVEDEARLPAPFAVASALALLAVGLLVFVEPIARADRTIRPFAREVIALLEREPGARLHGYRIVDDVGRIEGALAFELGRTFPTFETEEALRKLLAADPLARVLMDRPVWDAEGRPGTLKGEFAASRRRMVLVGR